MSNGSIQGQTYLSLQGGELQGNVEMNGNKITGLGDAIGGKDAVNLGILNNKLQHSFFNQFRLISTIYPSSTNTVTINRPKASGLPLFILIEADVDQSGIIFTYSNSTNINLDNVRGKISYTNNVFKQKTVLLATLGGIFGNEIKYIVNGHTVNIGNSYVPMTFVFRSDSSGNYVSYIRLESNQNTPISIYAGPSKI